jgi:phage tail sheath protein FI
VYRYVPLNGDTAGLMVQTDLTRDPWYSPAGFNRGNIKNTIRLAYNPNKADRDLLYKKGVNPVVTFPGQGTVLFGDKTLLSQPSAFDRINVRRLFIVLEKAISTASRFTLFEFNDEFTRAQFRNLVEPFLRDVQGRRGITDFRVVCDSTNNTGEVVDRNEFVGDIYIKPTRSINFIQLNFVAVRSGVEFSEVVGQFG